MQLNLIYTQKIVCKTLNWLVEYAKPQQLHVIFYQHRWEGDRYRGISENALGPPAFAEDVRRRPCEADTFRNFATGFVP